MIDRMKDLPQRIPEEVIVVIRTLESAGFEAYLVGGSIRDALLGKIPGDWDVACSATAEQITAMFPHTAPLGARFGTIRILLDGVVTGRLDGPGKGLVAVDAAAFRIDSAYSDRRRPDSVAFTDSLLEDLKRRDFTINAMAWHPDKGLVDPMNGRQDLELKILRTVGEPTERFQEDPLRILRGIRFAAQLAFEIQENALDSMKQLAHLLDYVSVERKQIELEKILLSDSSGYGLGLTQKTGTIAFLLKKSWCLAYQTRFQQMSQSIDDTRKDRFLRWAILFACFDPVATADDIRSLRFDRRLETYLLSVPQAVADIWKVASMDGQKTTEQNSADPNAKTRETAWKKFLSRHGYEDSEQLLELAIVLPRFASLNLEGLQRLTERIQSNKEPVFLQDLALDGSELIRAGIPAGEKIGLLLQQLLVEVHQDPTHNTKDQLLTIAENFSGNP